MRVRTLKHRPRRMIVCRAGAWGEVAYVRKRAYAYGSHAFGATFSFHCPADALGLLRTAQAAETWRIKSADEVRADIRALWDREEGRAREASARYRSPGDDPGDFTGGLWI